jgi:hypothetical protein
MAPQAMKLSVLIGADASGLKSGGAEAEGALEKIKEAAADAGQSVQQLLSKQEQLGKVAANTNLGADNLKAYASQLDAMRAKYDPLFGVISRYKTEVVAIRQAHDAGALTADKMTAALSRQRKEALAAIAALKGQRTAAASIGGDSNVQFRRQNLGYQAFDIGQGLASGLPLPMILAQQGPQIAQAYVGNGGIKALAADARVGLSSIIGAASSAAAAIGPVGLAFAGVSTAALAFYALTRQETKTTDQILEEHAANIKALGDAYNIATNKAKEYSDADRAIALAKAQSSNDELQQRKALTVDDFVKKYSTPIVNQFGGSGEMEYAISSIYKPFEAAFEHLSKNKDYDTFVGEITKLGQQTGNNELAKQIIQDADALTEVSRKGKEGLQVLDQIANLHRLRPQMAGDLKGDKAYQDFIKEQETQLSELNRNQSLIDAQQQQTAARTIEEKVAAARAVAKAQGLVAGTDSQPVINQRADQAAEVARRDAEREAKRATEDRLHAANAALTTARQELAIAGQSLGVQEQKKAALEAQAAYLDQIYRSGQAFNQADLDTLKKKAVELAKIQQQIAITNSIQQRGDDISRLRMEVSLAQTSTAERQKQLALFDAEREIRDKNVTDPNQAEEIRKQAVAQAELNAQIAAGNTLRQQGDNIERLQRELELAGATTAERTKQLALLEAEQKIKAAGITDQKEIEDIKAKALAQADLNQKLVAANFIRQQGQDIERLRQEVALAQASTAERQKQLALYDAEQRIKQGNITDPAQAAAIRQQATEVANLNSQLAAQNALKQQNDDIARLQLEISLVGASVEERTKSIAAYEAEKQIRDQGIDSMGREAAALRAGAQARADLQLQLERQQAAYQSLHDAESGMIDTFVSGLSTMGSSWKDTFKNMLQQGLQFFNQLAIGNPLKNALTGSNLPTLTDFFTGKSTSPLTAAATNTGTMTVNAATVMINGAPLGLPTSPFAGATATVPGQAAATNPINGAAATVSRILPVANQNVPTTDIEAYIRQAALARGIDPNTAVAVARTEGGLTSWNMQSRVPLAGGPGGFEPSYGPYQLYMNGGLGSQFMQQTGLDPRLAQNGPAAINFALDNAKQNGWTAFHGAANNGISQWQGIRPGVDPTTTNSIQQFNTSVKTAATNVSDLAPAASDASKALTQGDNSLVGSITKASQTAQQPAPAAPGAQGGLPIPGVGSGTAPGAGIFSSISGIIGSLLKGFTGIFSSLFSGIGNIFSSLFGGLFANGAAFSRGNIIPFATGGIVTKPTLFPMAGGRMGVMGEAGEEAIVPLHRGRGGKLGVAMAMPRQVRQGGELKLQFSSTHNVNLYGTTDAELQQQWREGTRLALDERDRQWRDSLPDMIESWRRDPWARMKSA